MFSSILCGLACTEKCGGHHSCRQGVLNAGGHTAEMFKILDALDKTRYQPRVYIAANTDKLAAVKVQQHESKWRAQSADQSTPPPHSPTNPDMSGQTRMKAATGHAELKRIPRSREVGQSWVSSALSTAWASLFCVHLLLHLRPRLVLANGAGTCLPVCLFGWLLGSTRLLDCKVVFVESIARTERLSMTGRILYRLHAANLFLVQWGSLAAKFPRAKCVGRVY
jgi:beta-1,4-N-acetylglucosaminyltransferase